jgi:hypothetical protein
VVLLALGLVGGCGDAGAPKPPGDAGTQRVDPEIEAQLQALGYVDFVAVDQADLGKSGVMLHLADRAHAGYNLFNTPSSNQALLIDMDGDVVHRWHNADLKGARHHIEMLANGDLLAIAKDGYLARLNWSSNLRWRLALPVHHDIEVGPGGEVFVLVRNFFDVPVGLGSAPLINDAIARVSAEGKLLEKIYFHELLSDRARRKLWEFWLRSLLRFGDSIDTLDLLHMNSLEYVDRDLAGLPTAETFLVCACNLDLFAFVDLAAREVIWSWGDGVLDRPHQPSVMQNGNILVFDNGKGRGWSRVVELEPSSGTIVWEYRGSPPEAFFSRSRGGAQELPNGNVLITESDKGRAFEVRRDGEIVWEFYNPDLVEEASGQAKRGAIYRLTRIEKSVVAALLH